ncbi:YesL family protein [Streptomyces sp. B6B3]|uniref:YesL family protein n=1 Tax=Streptomyces sp. B6B3 TaxID=3153570 RepID=UPI00325CD758
MQDTVPDSAFARGLGRLADLVLAGLLWTVASLPLVTLPAATTALFAVADGWVRGESPPVLATFRDAFRRRPVRGLAVGGALAAGAAVVAVDVAFAAWAEGAPLRAAVLVTATLPALATALAAAFAFPLLALTDDGPVALLRNAVLLAVGNPLPTVAAWATVAAGAALAFVAPPVTPLLGSLAALTVAWLARRALSRVPTPTTRPSPVPRPTTD